MGDACLFEEQECGSLQRAAQAPLVRPVTNVTPFLVIFLVGLPMLGALYAAPLIFARHLWGSWGLWLAALVCTAGMGWGVVNQDPSSLHQPPGELVFVTGLFLAWGFVPAYLVGRASGASPMPPIWKRVAYSVGGMYLGAIITFVVAALVLLASLAIKRLG